MRKKIISIILIISIIATSLSGCGDNLFGKKPSFEEFTRDLFLREITGNTLNLHYTLEDPAGYGIRDYPITLGGYDPQTAKDYLLGLQELKFELLSFPFDSLTPEEQLTYDILADYLDTQIDLSSFTLYEEPLSYSNGMQVQLPILLAEYEFNSEQDVTDYLKLITLVDDYFRDMIAFEQDKSAAGLFMSDELCDRVIHSCEAFLENQDHHYMLQTFENRLQDLNLSEKKEQKYIKSNQKTFEQEIIPAYETLITELTQLKGTGKNDGGICNLPRGKRYYELLVYSEVGCDDSINNILSRIETQRFYDLLVCADLLEQNPHIFAECDAISWSMPEEKQMLEHLEEAMCRDFPACPKTNYSIHHVDPALKAYMAPAFYITAPIDNYMDNTIYINDGNDSSDIYYFTTLAHEGFPGHLYQTVMSYEYEMLPIRSILNYSGYCEGWATYIEMMSYYYADIKPELAEMLSHNQAATLSLYATADIGIHYKNWSEEDIYLFWESYGITDRDTIDEITRLILSEPGNYLKYYLGYLEFLDLRDYARNTLGSNYSTIEFHRAILDIGPAPFPILEKYLEEFYSPQT